MTAIPVHHTATSDATWDVGKARKGYPNDSAVLHYVSGWYDPSGDQTSKSTYKFPHHYSNGGPAVLAAVRNGLSRLPNAQVDDKDGVEAHLQAHLDDGEGESPESRAPMGPFAIAIPGRPRTQSWKKVYDDWRQNVNARADDHVVPAIYNADNPNELMIYDEIGYWGVTAQRFLKDLTNVKGDFTLRINSPGGDMFDGLAIYNAILAHDGFVTAQVDGLAASAASFIAMACDMIIMTDASMMMIHDAIGMSMGNAADMIKMADLLDKSSQSIAGIYSRRAGKPADYWRGLMKDETWLNGDEAVDYGLADETSSRAVLTDKHTSRVGNQTPVLVPIPDAIDPPATVPEPELVTVQSDARSIFKYAMADATREPDTPDLPPFTLDPELFRVVMAEAANHAPAEPPTRAVKTATTINPSHLSLSELTAALMEGLK